MTLGSESRVSSLCRQLNSPLTTVVAQTISGTLAPLLFPRYRLRNLLLLVQVCKTALLLSMTLYATSLLQPGTLWVLLAVGAWVAVWKRNVLAQSGGPRHDVSL